MTRLLLPCLLLIVTAVAEEFPGTVTNPALARFSDRITFLASFDDGLAAAEMAAGSHAPRSVQEELQLAPGIFGQALAGGTLSFSGDGNFRFGSTGTLLFWISPVDWREGENEGYQWWFQSSGEGSGLLIGRQGEIVGKRRATVYYHATTAGRKAGGEHIGGGGWRDWPNGSWHLIVVTWQLGRIGISVDGSRPRAGEVGELTPQVWFNIGRKQADGGHFLLDDFMILDRPLTAAEIAIIWRDSEPHRALAEAR